MEASLLEFDPDKSPELLAEKNEMLEIVRELLKKIEPARAQMLKWRFGLDGSPPLTLEECARKWGVTPQCVQVKEKVALRDIRTFIRKKNLAASMLSTKKQHWISGRAIDDVMSEGKRKKEAAAALWKIRKLRGNLLPQTIGGAEGKDGNA